MEENLECETPVVRFLSPEALRKEFDLTIPEEGVGLEGVLSDISKCLEFSVRTVRFALFLPFRLLPLTIDLFSGTPPFFQPIVGRDGSSGDYGRVADGCSQHEYVHL